MMKYAVGDRVCVNSALRDATVVGAKSDPRRGRIIYTVEFPDGRRISRYESELT